MVKEEGLAEEYEDERFEESIKPLSSGKAKEQVQKTSETK
jgi:hypothetical protein